MTIRGGCHCGQTRFEVDGELPATLTRCTCSFCARRGPLYAYFAPEAFRQTAGSGTDAVYRWHTMQVAHHFCPNCGCGTFSNSPAFEPDGGWDGVTRQIGVNARLIDDLDAAAMPVKVIDGKNLW